MSASANAEAESTTAERSPFDLRDAETYAAWRAWKLADYPTDPAELLVEIEDPAALSAAEVDALMRRLRKTNMALYQLRQGAGDRDTVTALGRAFGLARLDEHLVSDKSCVTALEVAEDEDTTRRRYIPYTDRPIRWHTDGYYNTPAERIRAMVLHCVRPAAAGGENRLLDHEIAYLLMRDADPALVEALAHPAAFVIPPNELGDSTIRGARPNPVFYVDGGSGALCMNYSMRKRNIDWRDDPATAAAVAFLENLLESDSPYVLRHRMSAGQGLLCNNVLHDRAGFENAAGGPGRLMYRGRYFDRIAGTGLVEVWTREQNA